MHNQRRMLRFISVPLGNHTINELDIYREHSGAGATPAFFVVPFPNGLPHYAHYECEY